MHHMAQPDIHRYSQNIKQEKKKISFRPLNASHRWSNVYFEH